MSDNQKKEVGKRLMSFREFLSIKQGIMAESLKLKQGSYSDIERGKSSIQPSALIILDNIYKLNSNWLLTGEGGMFINSNSEKDRQELIISTRSNVRLYNIDASAGGLIAAQDEYGAYLEEWFVPDLVGEHIAVNVHGSSMSPSMEDGDKVIAKEIHRNGVSDGKIYIVVTTDGSVRIKRLRMNNEVLMLWSDNLLHEPRYEKVLPEHIVRLFHVVMVCKRLMN